jgi:hypothetical protein
MKQRHWLERPTTIRQLWIVFIAILALTVIAQIFIPVHGHFGLDGTFGFNAWYGFSTCIAMVAVAKALGIFLKRKDTYYGDDDE